MRPQSRLALAIASASVTNGATATATAIDTNPSGVGPAKHVTIDIVATTANVVSNKPGTLKLQHSDTTDASNYSDITGSVGGTDFTIPNADTTNPNLYKFNVNMVGRKRYIKVAYSPQTTQTVFAVANLHWNQQAATTATRANVLALVDI